MNQFSKSYCIQEMEKTGIIPVFYHADAAIAKNVLDISYQAGIRVFEFTNRGDHALEVFTTLVDHARKYPDLILGVGTLFEPSIAEEFYNVGAQFIVSPMLNPELAAFCKTKDILWIPGCGTVTEAYTAMQLGAKLIKIFPGNVLGPAFAKAIKAVLPHLRLMPTGGVSPTVDNLTDWFRAGVSCVGMGSQLFKKEQLEKNDFNTLAKNLKETITIIKNRNP